MRWNVTQSDHADIHKLFENYSLYDWETSPNVQRDIGKISDVGLCNYNAVL